VIIAPLVVGIGIAWHEVRNLDPFLLSLIIIGSVFLHIAANSIDDVYDFINGVDRISDQMFPKDFPGWKPIPRGLMSVNEGLAISFLFYAMSLAIGVYLAFIAGWIALMIAIPGIVLSYFYVAPPLKLDYRGLGLGELAIFLSFGPIPALGAYYVLTQGLHLLPVLASIPSGILTVNVLLSHDMIFYDAYKVAGKRSLTVRLGRISASKVIIVLGILAYAMIFSLIAIGSLPSSSLLVALTLPLFLRKEDLIDQELSPPQYGVKTMRVFVHSIVFSFLLALSLFI
jgi:1,4-dihydroxy-2-naphthoate octaprenyltransferase